MLKKAGFYTLCSSNAMAKSIARRLNDLKQKEALIKHLDPNDTDRVHFLACNARSCVRCMWARQKHRWQRDFLQDASRPGSQSWIPPALGTDGVLRFGCAACKLAGASTAFATCNITPKIIQQSTWVHHEATEVHKKAIAKIKGVTVEDPELRVAPSAENFLALLKLIRANKSCTYNTLIDIGKRKKLRRMTWCLAEARRSMYRDQILKAVSSNLHQDSRKGRLAIRFQCCGNALSPTAGVLGTANIAKDYSLDARGLQRATIAIIQQFATPKLDPPNAPPDHAAQMMPEIENKFKTCVELFDADAAADEQLAGKLLQGKPVMKAHGSQTFDGYLENLRVRNKDTPHGTRRTCICCTPWHACME